MTFEGEIVAYGGKDTLKNTTLLKFILNRYDKFFLTYDLDAEDEVRRAIEVLGLERGKRYSPIGIDAPGKRDIEGLLPEDIRKTVYASNVDLVQGAMSAIARERNEAKAKLKKALLEAFKSSAKPGDQHFAQFYKLIPVIRKALNYCAGLLARRLAPGA